MPSRFLLEEGLFGLCQKNLTMNMIPSYTRAFPILLGSAGSRLKLASSFICKSPSIHLASNVFENASSNKVDSTNLKSNPFYEKYAAKIEKLKYTDPEEYTKRLAALQVLHSKPQENKSSSEKPISTQNHPSNEASSNISDAKSLDSILNLEKVKPLSTDEIRALWIERYASKDAVCAVIPSATYQTLREVATLYPMFVYPVPRKDGYEMFVGQFSDDDFHFTSLINYQRHHENAVSQLTLKHYIELENDKGIVLMSGQVLGDPLSVTDAQLLSYLVQHFYVEHRQLIEGFNQSPNTFNFEDVISSMDETLLMKAGKLP